MAVSIDRGVAVVPKPVSRQLRIFSFDPSVSAQFHTATIGEITVAVPWEELQPGPVGEYLEVVDADPASGVFYRPVDLNHPHVLAQNGLPASETNPQFHQQMVYAVAMNTILQFEQALGRVALWSTHGGDTYVQRLRIYPHALRDRNAYYSPDKKALLFGYFTSDEQQGSLVFTCLSHDIVAHETTHALLDGVHPRFHEAVNVDVLAFHEAFADIVALFQHFSYPGVLKEQISRTRGNLASESMLGQLAQQFGRATGRGTALRDALGGLNQDGRWEAHRPDPGKLARTKDPHGRGAILVAAIFGAFLKVYRARTLDLFRIASQGTGVLPEGDIHPDLANRLAEEAARTAQTLLQMCIRAIDYCPPVGITFGDYLRAIVTADYDVTAEDRYGFRLAVAESMREWGIHPSGMRTVSVESMMWPSGEEVQAEKGLAISSKDIIGAFSSAQSKPEAANPARQATPWHLESNRYQVWKGMRENAKRLHAWFTKRKGRELAPAFNLVLDKGVPATVSQSNDGIPYLEVHSVRTALRRTPRGGTTTDLVVEITQKRDGYFDEARQDRADQGHDEGKCDFTYRAGCTLIIDEQMNVRRVVTTAGSIVDNEQLEAQRRYRKSHLGFPLNEYHTSGATESQKEPFALLHELGEER